MLSEAIRFKTFDTASFIDYINKLETTLKQVQLEYQLLKESYDLLVYKRFARSAEQLLADKTQLLLFGCEEVSVEEIAKLKPEELTEVKSFTRKKAGRKAIDEKIPREIKIIDIAEEEKTCACGARLTRIGEETNEKLHVIPMRIFVEKTIRPKYACRCCEGTENEEEPAVRIAPVEPSIIPKGIASPSLLSCIMIQKYEDHLPFYRQERQFRYIGVTISRQDMSNWQQQVYSRLRPLFELLKEMLKKGPVMLVDETSTQVMGEEGRADTQKSYIWVAQGGLPDNPVTIYNYRQTRGSKHVQELLSGYSGYLQTDGYVGYDTAVEGNDRIKHVGCFVHTRRTFFEAHQVSAQSTTAKEGMDYIKALYVIESKLRERYKIKAEDSEKERDRKRKLFTRVRQLCAWRVLKTFKAWLMKQQQEVLPSSHLGKAVSYSLAQWDKLVRYLESPYMTPDTNACENAIRPFVLGRKNWLFNKSPKGAESSCGMFSLIQTAKQNGLIPRDYLTALFERAPFASSPEDWEKLLPWNIEIQKK